MKKFIFIAILCLILLPLPSFAKKEKATIPDGAGYVGTLPNLGEAFQGSKIEEVQQTFEYKDGFNDPDSIKPIPRDNPSFVNIIIKKDKTSQYINDLNDLITIIENLEDAMEAKTSIQIFNAKTYFLKENVEYFRDKYKNKAEESFISYKKVMALNTHAQAVSQLRLQKELYSPYVTSESNGNMFSQNNIDQQMDYLLDDIKKTLIVLKETK